MRPRMHPFLPERILALSISASEVVLPEGAAMEAIDIAEAEGVLILGWEGWVKCVDGRVGHGSAPQGTVSLDSLGLSAAAALCRETIREDAATWRGAQALATTPEYWTNLQASRDLASNRPRRRIRRLAKAGSSDASPGGRKAGRARADACR